MKGAERITRDELLKKMDELSTIYDVVRLVEPESSSVVTFDKNGVKLEHKNPCFSVWDKEQRCNNCISRKACMENRRITKFEFRNKETYNVLAMPYIIIDGDTEYKLSMEIVYRVEDDLVIDADGLDPLSMHVKEINDKLYQDSLTGVLNRRYFDESQYIFDMEHTIPKKIGYLMIDVNHFKAINDEYGHARGDEVLAKIANIIQLNIRSSDKLIRIGGDEFLIVMRDCNLQFLEKKIYKIKRAVSKISFTWLVGEILSVAIGMSYTDHYDGTKSSLKKLFADADADMYEDKKEPEEYSSEKNILIVDDMEMNRAMIKKLLQGYFIFEAENGVEALNVLQENHIDIIITDIFMDKMNGYEFMTNVKSNSSYRDIPIVAVTENNESSQKKAIEAGADIYIDRPIGAFISNIVAKMTGQDHGRKELFDLDFILDTIPGAIIVYKIHDHHKMEIVSCSRGVKELTGWESDEFCENDEATNIDAILPNDLEKFTSTIERMIRTHSRGDVIYRAYKKDGSLVWIWFQGRYIGEEDGCSVVEAIMLDVSNNTNMYQSILDESSSLITVVDAHSFEVLYANKMADLVVNQEHGPYIGSVCYNYIFHRDKPCEHCIARRRKNDVWQAEVERNGRLYQQDFKRILWHGVEAFLEYTTDVTAEKQNIAYAENEKNQQSLIVQNLPSGIIVFESSNQGVRMLEANQNFCDMMCVTMEELKEYRNKDFIANTHKEDIRYCKKIVKELLEPDADVTYDFRYFSKTKKKYIWLRGRGRSVRQPNGMIYAYIIYNDISAEKELEKTEHKLLLAEKTAEAKADFYSRMSHDMRTPMNGILGIAELAREEKEVPALLSDIEKIEESGKYMLNLINDTLDYQRLESKKLTLNPDVIYVEDFLNTLVAMMQTSATNKGVELITDYSGINLKQHIWIDEMRLKQIIVNMISNAIKFTPKGGKVIFKIERLGFYQKTCHVEISITDTGVGMSKKYIENGLFKPFSQEKNAFSMKYAGSGLGLSIVKSLVTLMGGRIEVESEIGCGSKFSIFLDVERVTDQDAEKHNAEDAESKVVHLDLSGRVILLCEDHPLNAEIVKRILQRVNAIVEWAKDGQEGVTKFKEAEAGYYSAILMDIRMPIMDGLEATKEIRSIDRKDAKTIPIIAMSANAYEEDIRKSLLVGMNDHLSKPVESSLIYKTLEKYLKDTN